MLPLLQVQGQEGPEKEEQCEPQVRDEKQRLEPPREFQDRQLPTKEAGRPRPLEE